MQTPRIKLSFFVFSIAQPLNANRPGHPDSFLLNDKLTYSPEFKNELNSKHNIMCN